jgi:coatomer subunit beta
MHQNSEYQQLLIKSIHSCAVKFSEIASDVIYELMELLGESQGSSGVDVISFVR